MRRAVVRTDHGDGATARAVGAAVRPDNTEEMDTAVEGTTVVTTVRRETTGGLQSTVDDYVVNLGVAARLATDGGADPRGTAPSGDARTDTHMNDSDNDTNTDT